jgi:dienelactone hydrolase
MTAGLEAVRLSSDGSMLIGGLYRAAQVGPRPAVLLLHGIPGHEKNLDLAISLRACGMHVLYIHYRGCWGSQGDYHLAHLVPDATAALAWLADHPLVRADSIGLAGISLGGWTALATASASPGVRAVAALSPLLDPNAPMRGGGLTSALAAEFSAPLSGISPEDLLTQWAALPALASFAGGLKRLPILLVTADGDELFPPEHFASAPALLPHLTWQRFPRADHVFSDVRPGLCHLVTRWFVEQLGA